MPCRFFPEDHSECNAEWSCGDADCPYGFHAVIANLEEERRITEQKLQVEVIMARLKKEDEAFDHHCRTHPPPAHHPKCGKPPCLPICWPGCPYGSFAADFRIRFSHNVCKTTIFCTLGSTWACPVALDAFAKQEVKEGRKYTGDTVKARAQKHQDMLMVEKRKKEASEHKRVQHGMKYPGFEIKKVAITEAEIKLKGDRLLGKFRVKNESKLRKSITKIQVVSFIGRKVRFLE